MELKVLELNYIRPVKDVPVEFQSIRQSFNFDTFIALYVKVYSVIVRFIEFVIGYNPKRCDPLLNILTVSCELKYGMTPALLRL